MDLKIDISGFSLADLEQALEEVTKRVSAGNTSGSDCNETGGLSFEVTGEPIEKFVVLTESDQVDFQDELAEDVETLSDYYEADERRNSDGGFVFGIFENGNLTKIN